VNAATLKDRHEDFILLRQRVASGCYDRYMLEPEHVVLIRTAGCQGCRRVCAEESERVAWAPSRFVLEELLKLTEASWHPPLLDADGFCECCR
jgi:hypothetical protein